MADGSDQLKTRMQAREVLNHFRQEKDCSGSSCRASHDAFDVGMRLFELRQGQQRLDSFGHSDTMRPIRRVERGSIGPREFDQFLD